MSTKERELTFPIGSHYSHDVLYVSINGQDYPTRPRAAWLRVIPMEVPSGE